jgi:hypothetical protein
MYLIENGCHKLHDLRYLITVRFFSAHLHIYYSFSERILVHCFLISYQIQIFSIDSS